MNSAKLPIIPLVISNFLLNPNGEIFFFLRIASVMSKVIMLLTKTIWMVEISFPANFTKIDMRQYANALRAINK